MSEPTPPVSDLCVVCDAPAEPEQTLCRACLEGVIARLEKEAGQMCDACSGLPPDQQGTWCGPCYERLVFG